MKTDDFVKTRDFESVDPATIDAMKSRPGDDTETREKIAALLADGLETQTEPFPETEKEFREILGKLHELPPDDLKGGLVISGFLNHPYGEAQQRCFECMYYLVHRKWCDIPERAVPVEPDWWCRLWRV